VKHDTEFDGFKNSGKPAYTLVTLKFKEIANTPKIHRMKQEEGEGKG